MQILGAWLPTPAASSRLNVKFRQSTIALRRCAKPFRSPRGLGLSVQAFVPQQEGKRIDTFPRELEYSAVGCIYRMKLLN